MHVVIKTFKKTQPDHKADFGSKAFQEYMKTQPIWHDSDMIRSFIIGAVIGCVAGMLIGYGFGLPDLSGSAHIGIRG